MGVSGNDALNEPFTCQFFSNEFLSVFMQHEYRKNIIQTHEIDCIVTKPWYVPCNGLENWIVSNCCDDAM